ncbi:MAG: AraC family transcriptional regulator, partial [Paenibacillus sp.]|nr:AraC family transcriptional regulator [Paenibacillus sp.]
MMTAHSLFHYVPTLETLNYRERLDRFMIDMQNLPEWVLFAVVDGSFYYEINELKGIAAYGDIVVCPPNTNFRRAVVSSPVTFFAIRIVWKSSSGVPLEPSELTPLPVGKINIQTTERLMDNYRRLASHDMLYGPIDIIKGNHVMHDIWLLYCDERSEQTKADKRLLLNEKDDVVEKARALLQQHALEALKLKEIAATLGVSAVQLTKWFKAVYDATPIQYVTMIRL